MIDKPNFDEEDFNLRALLLLSFEKLEDPNIQYDTEESSDDDEKYCEDVIRCIESKEIEEQYELIDLILKYGHEKFIKVVTEKEYDVIFASISNKNIKALRIMMAVYPIDTFMKQVSPCYGLSPLHFCIKYNEVKSFEEIIEFLKIRKKWEYIKDPATIFYALEKASSDIFKLLLKEYNSEELIKLVNEDQLNIIIYALTRYHDYFVFSNDEMHKEEAKKNLQELLKKLFPYIDTEEKFNKEFEKLNEFYKSYSYLMIGHTNKSFGIIIGNLYASKLELEKFSNNEKTQVFRDLSISIDLSLDKYIPYKINEEDLYIFSAGFSDHTAFFIFHIMDNQIKALSYVDSNFITFNKPKIETTEVDPKEYGVTKYILKEPIDIDGIEDLKHVITYFNNSPILHGPSIQYYEYLLSGKVFFEGQSLNECKKENFIKVKEASRGNCTLKSDKILQRYLASITNPKSFDEDYTGYELFKEYKRELKKSAIEKIVKFGLQLKNSFIKKYLMEKTIELLTEVRDKTLTKDNKYSIEDVEYLNKSIVLLKGKSTSLLTSGGSHKKR